MRSEACKEQSLRQIAACANSALAPQGFSGGLCPPAESLKCSPPSREAGEGLTSWSHLRIGYKPAAGRRIMTMVPSPRRLSMVILPPCLSTISFAIASPKPVPPDSRDRALSTR